VKLKKDNLRVVGLIHTRPPADKRPHHCLIVRITCDVSSDEVKQRWKNAKDKKEGQPVLVKFDKEKGVLLASKESNEEILYSTCLALLLVLNSISKDLFDDYKWFENFWRLGSLKPTSYSDVKSD